MRIIGGTARGAILVGGRERGVRPMLAHVKKSLFDILGSVEGARVLDLFAGTGGVGIEALSRGAAVCVFVEKNRRMAELIRKNLAKIGFGEMGKVFHRDALRRSRFLTSLGMRYDLVFMDPPYHFFRSSAQAARLARRVDELATDGLLSEIATVVVRHEVGVERMFLEELQYLEVLDVRKYGQSALTFLQPRNKNEEV